MSDVTERLYENLERVTEDRINRELSKDPAERNADRLDSLYRSQSVLDRYRETSAAIEEGGGVFEHETEIEENFFSNMAIGMLDNMYFYTEAVEQEKEKFWLERVFPYDKEHWENKLQFFIDEGFITQDVADTLSAIVDGIGGGKNIVAVGTILMLVLQYMNSVSGIIGARMQQSLARQTRPFPIGADQAVRSMFMRPEKTGQAHDALARNGISEDDIDLLLSANYRPLDTGTIASLWLRGLIEPGKAYEYFRELGFQDSHIEDMRKTFDYLPSISDLIWMVGKEAFEPETIREFGLGAEFPDDQMPHLEKHGVSDFWARKHWIAHWNQPSVTQGFEMLHRDVINDRQLDLLFRAQELPPFWREKMKDISYRVISRVDVRRMYQAGTIGKDKVLRTYMDMGYNDEDAALLTDWVVATYGPEDRDLTRAQITRAYDKYFIDRNTAVGLLGDIGYSQEYAEYIVEGIDYERELSYIEDRIDIIEDKFKKGIYEYQDAERDLQRLDIPASRVDLLLDRWQVETFEPFKLPSKTDLDKMIKHDVITWDEWRETMARLGYSGTYIDWYRRLYEAQGGG